jgi:cytochrome c553
MKRATLSLSAALLLAVAALTGADPARPDGPHYNAEGELLFPANYREWTFLSSGLGMNYGPLAAKGGDDPSFDNVFVSPSAYKAFLETGTWPEQTILVLEVRSSSSKGSINKAGHFQNARLGIEAEVKDSSRFPGKWAFFSIDDAAALGRLRSSTEACYSCHAQHGAVDNTFVQFYPTLLAVAKAKGTLREGSH